MYLAQSWTRLGPFSIFFYNNCTTFFRAFILHWFLMICGSNCWTFDLQKASKLIAKIMFLAKSPFQKMHRCCIRFGFIFSLFGIHFGVIFSTFSASNFCTGFEPLVNPKWFPKSTLRATIFDQKANLSQLCRPSFSTGVSFWELLAHNDWGWSPFGTLLAPF